MDVRPCPASDTISKARQVSSTFLFMGFENRTNSLRPVYRTEQRRVTVLGAKRFPNGRDPNEQVATEYTRLRGCVVAAAVKDTGVEGALSILKSEPLEPSRIWKASLYFDTAADSEGAQDAEVHLLEIKRDEGTASHLVLVEALILKRVANMVDIFERIGLLKVETLPKNRSLANVFDRAEERTVIN